MKEIIGELNILLVMGRELVNKVLLGFSIQRGGNEIKRKNIKLVVTEYILRHPAKAMQVKLHFRDSVI